MKIFSWVHRKFHQNNVDGSLLTPKKDGLANNVKKTETVTNETDTEALLNHVTLVNVLDGWKDGILTIGTFGFDPLNPSNQQNEYSFNNEEEIQEDDDDDEEEGEEYSVTGEEGELNPLVVKAFKREFEKVLGSNLDTNISKPDPITTIVDDTPLLRFLESPALKTESENDKKKRTTLADLFSADSDVVRKSDSGLKSPDSGKKTVSRTKHSLSFAKKFMPSKGEDSRPIRKLHRLITRMMKRKIHPELEGKIHGKEGLIDPSQPLTGNTVSGEDCTYDLSDDDGTTESVSLLREAVAKL